MPIITEHTCVCTPVARTYEMSHSGNPRHIYKRSTPYILNMTSLRLSVEPIPAGSRRASLANLMPRGQWDRLRRSVYHKAHYRCQICGREGRLYCHEIWQCNEKTSYQFLRGFEALCENCHNVRHLFFIWDSQHRARLFRHFRTINRLTKEQGMQHLADAYRQQQEFNKRKWIVNYGQYNFSVPSVPNVQHRRNYVKLNRPRYRLTGNRPNS